MSLKITDANGFVIGGVPNAGFTVIYVRVLPDTRQEKPIEDEEGNIVKVEVFSSTKITLDGGRFSQGIQVDYIHKDYGSLQYNVDATDINEKYLQLEEDLKIKLIAENPQWDGKIEIVNVGVGPVEP